MASLIILWTVMNTCLNTWTNWLIITCSLSCSMTLLLSENVDLVRLGQVSKGKFTSGVCFLNLTFSHFCYLLKTLSQYLSLLLLRQFTCSASYKVSKWFCYNPFFLSALSRMYFWINFSLSLIVCLCSVLYENSLLVHSRILWSLWKE